MAHSTERVAERDEVGVYPLKELDSSKNSHRPVQNPFLTIAEMNAGRQTEAIEEYEEVEEAEEETEESIDSGSNSNMVRPGRNNPYGRSQPPANHKTANSTSSIDGPRRRSRMNLLTPPNANGSPPIICLHGSNDSCMRSWLGLIESLYKSGYTCLLYDRPPLDALGGADLKPHRAVSELCSYLYSAALRGPFVFIAHGYGACVARLFLQQKPAQVAGMILVETGQETALAPQTEEEQYRRQILGDAPLSVVRGNLMRAKQDAWVRSAASARSETQKAQLEPQRLMLEHWEGEDERLKKKQLGLSRTSRFCQVPNCGPHPILEKPAAVFEEVRWVMGELAANGARQAQAAAAASAGGPGAGLRRGLSTRLASGLQRTFSKKGRA